LQQNYVVKKTRDVDGLNSVSSVRYTAGSKKSHKKGRRLTAEITVHVIMYSRHAEFIWTYRFS